MGKAELLKKVAELAKKVEDLTKRLEEVERRPRVVFPLGPDFEPFRWDSRMMPTYGPTNACPDGCVGPYYVGNFPSCVKCGRALWNPVTCGTSVGAADQT